MLVKKSLCVNKDDKTFIDCIKLFEDEGVEAITIHGRTRDQLYKGLANWSYIEQAVKTTSLPIIGNGDLWTTSDIKNIFEQTGCHSVMLGRGALKTPWMSKILKIKDREIYKKGKLKNKSFMFTGKLQNISRAEAKSLIEENSGIIVSSVNKKLDYLVIGEKPTNRKLEQAKNLGIQILTQKEWSDLLN